MKAKETQQSTQEWIERLLRSVRRTKRWTEEEVLELAYDEAHLSGEQLFDYWENKLGAAARAAVEAHAAACDFCLHQLAEMGALVKPWHPSIIALWQWIVQRDRNGVAEVAYHLEQDKCPRCHARCRRLEAVRNCVVSFLSPILLPNPQVAHARTDETLDVTVTSPDQRIEVHLFKDRGAMVLVIRTKDAALNHQLFGYALRDAEGREAVTGFLVLRQDVNDWYAAYVTFDDLNELFATLKGQCRDVAVGPVDADLLTDAEREALLASVEGSSDNAEAQAAWRAWADRAAQSEALPDDARQLIQDVRERLGQ